MPDPYGPNDQPFGTVREIDGIQYRVRRAYNAQLHPGLWVAGRRDKARWDLTRLTETGAAVVEAFVILDATATVADAEKRLLGI